MGVTITAPITAVANPDGPLILTRGIGAGVSLYANDTLNGVLVPPGAVSVQYTLNDNTVTFMLTSGGYLQLVNDMFASPGIYTLSYTFCEAGVASNCSTTSATINVQAPQITRYDPCLGIPAGHFIGVGPLRLAVPTHSPRVFSRSSAGSALRRLRVLLIAVELYSAVHSICAVIAPLGDTEIGRFTWTYFTSFWRSIW